MDDKNLQKQLNRPSAPKHLEARIRDNWHLQIGGDAIRKTTPSRLLVATAASVVLALATMLVVITSLSTPELVELAINDIKSDAKHNATSVIPLDAILQDSGIKGPLQNMPVKMAKYCNLNNTRTSHLRIAGAKQGEVHLFISKGNFDIPAWKNRQGQTDGMFWEMIQPGKNFSVLVLRSPDMSKDKVNQLIEHMFYA